MAKVNFTAAILIVIFMIVGHHYVEAQRLPRCKPEDAVPPTPPEPKTRFLDNWINNTLPVPSCSTNTSAFANIAATTRSGIAAQKYRWKNFFVQADASYTQLELNKINEAMWTLSQVIPCVKFGIYPLTCTPVGDYVKITNGKGKGCSSWVGKQGGRQLLYLESPWCMYFGTPIHEMIHALGFNHEQCRPDRDDYITIHYNNIQPGARNNFDIVRGTLTFGVEYDINSIMHYESLAFSRNWQPTITAKNGKEVGSLGYLRESDKKKLKAMYQC